MEAAAPGDVSRQSPLAAVATAALAVTPENASVEATWAPLELRAIAHNRAGKFE